MLPSHDKVKVFLLSTEILFGTAMLVMASYLINMVTVTGDWFGYTLPALILIIVGLASVSFGIDTLWLRADIDGWDPWE